MLNQKSKRQNFVVIAFGLIALVLQIRNRFVGTEWPILELILVSVSGLILFFNSVKLAIRKKFTPLILLAIICLISALVPFDYLYGMVDFNLKREDRARVLHNFESGGYDSLLKKKNSQRDGIRINSEENRIVDLYHDSLVSAIFFFQNFEGSKVDYSGILYISDVRYLDSARIIYFLKREFVYKKLAKNWYWIKCHAVIEPGQ